MESSWSKDGEHSDDLRVLVSLELLFGSLQSMTASSQAGLGDTALVLVHMEEGVPSGVSFEVLSLSRTSRGDEMGFVMGFCFLGEDTFEPMTETGKGLCNQYWRAAAGAFAEGQFVGKGRVTPLNREGWECKTGL